MSLSGGSGTVERRLTEGIAPGLLWMGGGKAVQAGLRLLVLIVLARLIAPADFGVVSAAMVVIGFSLIFSQLGLGPAIIQRPELEPRHLATAFATSVTLGLALGGLVWWSAPAAARVFPHVEGLTPVLRALAWLFPLAGLGVVSDSLVHRELRFRFLATVDVSTLAVGYGVVGVTLALLEFGIWALVAAQLVQTALRTAVFLAVRPPVFLAPSRRALGELLYFGGGFTASKVANYAALQGDNLVVGRWLGAEALGLYGRAYELMAAPVYLLGEALDQVLFPILARMQADTARLAGVFLRGVALIALAMLPASAVLLAIAPEFILVVLGPRWAGVVAPFQILALGMFLRTSYRISDALARATGAVYRRAWRQAAYAALVILGAWIGQHWGIAGVAAGVLVALTANFFLMAHLSLRLGGLSWGRFWEAHRSALRLTGATGLVAWILTERLHEWGVTPATLLVVVVAGALGSIVLLAWASPRLFLGPDGLWLLNKVREWTGPPAHRLAGIVRHATPKRPANGGMVVALVGADGAGKSTCAAELDQWLGKEFATLHLHLGRPPRSFLTLAVGAVLKPARYLEAALTTGERSVALVRCLELVRHVCTARDRYRVARKAQVFAARGGVAICERYPVAPEPTQAGPRIGHLVHTLRWQKVAALLRDLEADYYRRIDPADLLVVLRVSPETAVQRKTSEPASYVRYRANALARVDWSGSDARIVDANRPLPQVVAELKSIVWSEL